MHSVILDMDPGVDDALALLWLIGAEAPSMRALTTVSGNVDVEVATTNALKLLDLVRRPDVPVFRGASMPLARDAIRATHIHGATGLGAAQLPAAESPCAEGEAADIICSLLNGEKEQFTVIAVGPLTNLAQAESRSPGVLCSARELVIMGGAIRVAGNVTPTGEFNFVSDPEAARIVINSGARIRLVPLDATRQMLLTANQLRSSLRNAPEALRSTCEQLTRTAMNLRRMNQGQDGIYLHDPLTAMLAVRPDLAEWETLFIDIETRGELTAGQVVTDERPQQNRSGTPVSVAGRIDRDAVVAEFSRGFQGSQEATG